MFAPDQRLSAAQALLHPYVQRCRRARDARGARGLGAALRSGLASRRFHCPASEWTLEAAVRLPGQEEPLSAREYRRCLYRVRAAQPRPVRCAPHGPACAAR